MVTEKPKRFMVSVDPGMKMGFALWERNAASPLMCGSSVSNRKTQDRTWQLRSQDPIDALFTAITSMTGNIPPEVVAVEWPAFFPSSKGFAVAAKGDLGKLFYQIGYLAGALRSWPTELRLVEVVEWKGQLPKDVCHRRIKALLEEDSFKGPIEQLDEHTLDAVGIGYFVRRRKDL